VIVSLHVATGALAGAVLASRRAAIPVGLALHLAGDVMPHGDVRSRRFEVASGIAGVVALGLRRGFGDPATVGAIASSIPDVEHVLPLRRAGGRKLFPSHRWAPLHRSGGVSAGTQLAVAAAVLAAFLLPGGR
jgi:hypothetical protein